MRIINVIDKAKDEVRTDVRARPCARRKRLRAQDFLRESDRRCEAMAKQRWQWSRGGWSRGIACRETRSGHGSRAEKRLSQNARSPIARSPIALWHGREVAGRECLSSHGHCRREN
ncbi:hypothetical protein Scep_005517 [Stephania cephalantha]|uniref:Uncharacterized protein n=1 Tax=Stephania cephalantha TaxID=152367 RepID=A0AAP0KVW6_9MAGN